MADVANVQTVSTDRDVVNTLAPGGYKTEYRKLFTGEYFDPARERLITFREEPCTLSIGISRGAHTERDIPREVGLYHDGWIRPDGHWAVLMWVPDKWQRVLEDW